jgi:tol-pal system protein YbgF
MDLLNQLTSLQREVQQLRGDSELQNHTLEGLQKRQRELYLDIDRRLHRLEAGGVAGEAASPPSYGTTPPTVPGASVAPDEAMGGPDTRPPAPAAPPALNPADQRKAYDRALELLKEGRYDDAAGAFQKFVAQYPDSSYADNAQYWLGEVYYVTRQFQPALTEFNKVLSAYPGSAKIADARLKMGYIQYELKDWGKARELLSDVVSTYPGSTSARLAQERLDRMQKEGR